MTVSQSFLVFSDRDSFEEYWQVLKFRFLFSVCLDWGSVFWGEKTTEATCPSHYITSGSTWDQLGVANLHDLAKVVLAKFLLRGALFFLFLFSVLWQQAPKWSLHCGWKEWEVEWGISTQCCCCFLKIFFIYSWETERERQRERDRDTEGEVGSMQEAPCGTRSWVSRTTPGAEGGAKPLSHLGCPIYTMLFGILV